MGKSSRFSRDLFARRAILALLPSLLIGSIAFADDSPHDPGVRGGAAGAGGPLPGVNTDFFKAAKNQFSEVEGVVVSGGKGGLGPRFNLDSCGGCHSQPQVGGTSPFTNPQVAVATLDGADNDVPPFITLHGPVREARFIKRPNGTPDGGVHDLFVITGRSDAPGCNISQPDFAQAILQNNIIFRVPTPTFGLGLVQNTPDQTLIDDVADLAGPRAELGIGGHFNTSGNDGTITRFGWKAQNKSLLMFSGEAYNVEMGITNELFPTEREEAAGCRFNATPENFTDAMASGGVADTAPDIVLFEKFMEMLAPPSPIALTASAARGKTAFGTVGCDLCHVPSHKTGPSTLPGLSNVTFIPYSDIQLHRMGQELADRIEQGAAAGDEFRTAPLWGVGQRIFFLHDGRTADLLEAIEAHAGTGSEANAVIDRFNGLSTASKQDILNFLRSL